MMEGVTVTRREWDIHRQNYRGDRPGIFGESIDGAEGAELDRQGQVFGVKRTREKRLSLWLVTLWKKESDESLRRRVFLAYQKEFLKDQKPCIHNTWVGSDRMRCGDCGEELCWVSSRTAAKMDLFLTRLVEKE